MVRLWRFYVLILERAAKFQFFGNDQSHQPYQPIVLPRSGWSWRSARGQACRHWQRACFIVEGRHVGRALWWINLYNICCPIYCVFHSRSLQGDTNPCLIDRVGEVTAGLAAAEGSTLKLADFWGTSKSLSFSAFNRFKPNFSVKKRRNFDNEPLPLTSLDRTIRAFWSKSSLCSFSDASFSRAERMLIVGASFNMSLRVS